MKNIAISAFLGHAALAHAQWWAGAPDCAQDCFSSWWSSSTAWPAPTSYCSASQGASVSSCLREACSATPTAVTSYSSLSSSLCSQWSSCSSGGSTGVYTISAPAFTGNLNGPGNWGGRHRGDDDDNDNNDDNDDRWGGDHDWDNDGTDDRDQWNQYTRTWPGGTYTVTGCEWSGNVWAGGPGGCALDTTTTPGTPGTPGEGGGGGGCSPWGPWGRGWTWSTVTQTVTRVVTVTDTSAGVTTLSTSVGLGLVALAASGGVTSTSVIGAVETTAGGSASGGGGSGGSGSANPTGGVAAGAAAAAGGRDGVFGLKVVGAVLGGVVVVAAWL